MSVGISRLACAMVLALPMTAFALDDSTKALMMEALTRGTAEMPLEADGAYARAVAAVRAHTGDSGPVVLYAQRVRMFKDQPRCGRVRFVVGQPTAHQAWPEMGGQLNLCENGDPPQRECRNAPGKLVLASARCADGSAPVDTREVKQAIDDAVAAGSLRPQDAAKLMPPPKRRPEQR